MPGKFVVIDNVESPWWPLQSKLNEPGMAKPMPVSHLYHPL